MQIPKGVFETKEMLKQALAEKGVMVTSYADDDKFIGFIVELDEEQMSEALQNQVLSRLGVTDKTLEYFEQSTEEERAHIEKLALISYHKNQLDSLEKQIVK